MNKQTDTPATAPEATGSSSSKGSPRGCFGRRSVGCLLFLIGGGALVVAALPTLASRVAPGRIHSLVDDKIAGTLRIQESKLAWLSRQSARVRLKDPEQQQVGELRLTAPGLAHFRGGLGDLGRYELAFDLDVRVDALGRSNFARAIESSGPTSEEPESPAESDPPTPSKPVELGEILSRAVRVEIGPSSVAYHSENPTAKFASARIENLTGLLAVTPGRGFEFTLDGEVTEPEGGRLEVRVALPDPGAKQMELEPRFDVLAEGIPVELVDGLLGVNGMLTAWLGATAGVRAIWTPDPEVLNDLARLTERGAVELTLETPNAEVRQKLSIEGDRFALEPGGVFSVRPEASAFESLALGEEDPIRVIPVGAPSFELDLRQAQVVLPEKTVDGPAGTEPAWLVWLDGLELDLELRASRFDLTGAKLDASLAPVQLGVVSSPAAGVNVALRSGLGSRGAQPGEWSVDLALESAALEGLAKGEPLDPPARLSANLADVPSAVIDRYIASQAMLSNVLGSLIGVEFSGVVRGVGDADLSAKVSSALASANLFGTWTGKRLNLGTGVDPDETPDAPKNGLAFSLTPLANKSLVGQLVPILADVRSADPSDRARLDLLSATLPLDGDLSALEGEWVLDLGRVRASLLPGLAGQLVTAAAGSNLELIDSIEPLRMTVREGRVVYPGLELSVDGRKFPISGGFDLATRQLDLSTSVGLDRLGGEVGRFLTKARDVLPPDFGVPLRITGTPLAPQLSVTDSFRSELPSLLLKGATDSLQKEVENSIEKELQRGLEKLFGGG